MTQASSFAITLVAARTGILTDVFIDNLKRAVAVTGVVQSTDWLSGHLAFDITGNFSDIAKTRAAAQICIGQQPIDVFSHATQNRKKKLLVADMESTVIEQELLDELAKDLGVGPKVSDITRRAMNGEIDFSAALRERVVLMRGVPISSLERKMSAVTFMSGADTMLSTMHVAGAKTWLVTGGFQPFAKAVATRLQFDKVFSNEFVIVEGKLTGEIVQPVLDRFAKRDLLFKACEGGKIDLTETLVVGDGANDLPMLEACQQGGGLAIAYHAKDKVRASITNQINHTDLQSLLYAQGYRQEEFTSSSRRRLQ